MLAVYCDASVRPKGKSVEVSLGLTVVENGKVIHRSHRQYTTDYVDSATGEYLAVINAMRWLLRNAKPQKCVLYTDFIGIVKELEAEKDERSNESWTILALLDELSAAGFHVEVSWIGRELNIAHKEARKGLDKLKEVLS